MRKKILITGGSGFLGYEVLKKLSKNRNYQVFSIINKKKINKIENLNCYQVNLLNKSKLKKVVDIINPDIVLHFAGFVNPGENQKYKKKSKKINFLITKNLCDNLNKSCHIIFISTDKVYSKSNKSLKEKDLTYPSLEYAKNKIKSEKYIIKNFIKYHIFRVPIIHDKGNLRSNSIIDKMIIKIKQKKITYVLSNLYRSFLYLEDFNSCIIKSLTNKKFGIYNLGTKKMSYFERVRQISKKIKISHSKYLKIEENFLIKDSSIVLNSDKAKKILRQKFY